MRKKLKMLHTLLLLLGLAGCTSAENMPEQMITVAIESENTDMVEKNNSHPLYFIFDDEPVIPGKELSHKMQEAAISIQESATCVGSGMETLYQYDGFDITVQNTSSSDWVYSIYFNSSYVSTAEGLSIGDSEEKVNELYGDAVTRGGIALTYSDGNTELIILISDHTVVGIEYRLAV